MPNVGPAVAVDTQTAVSQHQLDNQPHLQPLEFSPGLREQPEARETAKGSATLPTLSLLWILLLLLIITPGLDFGRMAFCKPKPLHVQVFLCRIIILAVGPKFLNHPNLLPPDVLDHALP